MINMMREDSWEEEEDIAGQWLLEDSKNCFIRGAGHKSEP